MLVSCVWRDKSTSIQTKQENKQKIKVIKDHNFVTPFVSWASLFFMACSNCFAPFFSFFAFPLCCSLKLLPRKSSWFFYCFLSVLSGNLFLFRKFFFFPKRRNNCYLYPFTWPPLILVFSILFLWLFSPSLLQIFFWVASVTTREETKRLRWALVTRNALLEKKKKAQTQSSFTATLEAAVSFAAPIFKSL